MHETHQRISQWATAAAHVSALCIVQYAVAYTEHNIGLLVVRVNLYVQRVWIRSNRVLAPVITVH